LSSARASAAVRRLAELGIDEQRLRATGVADTQPQVEETDDVKRQQNRRIEIVLEPLNQ
jgi:chemotaxis protein MotB